MLWLYVCSWCAMFEFRSEFSQLSNVNCSLASVITWECDFQRILGRLHAALHESRIRSSQRDLVNALLNSLYTRYIWITLNCALTHIVIFSGRQGILVTKLRWVLAWNVPDEFEAQIFSLWRIQFIGVSRSSMSKHAVLGVGALRKRKRNTPPPNASTRTSGS